MKKIIYTSFIAISFVFEVCAQQDVHFSQFYSSPLTVNPSHAGLFNGGVRAMVNYRSQWAAVSNPFTTISGSVDGGLFKEKINNGFFGVGGNVIKDDAGDSQFSTLNGNLSLSYHFDLSGGEEMSYFSIGFQGGYLQRSISLGSLYWDQQWDGSTFNTSLPNNEAYSELSHSRLVFASGVNWYINSYDNSKQFYLGLSAFNLNAPNVGFKSSSESYLRKYQLNAGAEILFPNSTFSLVPNAIYMMQGPNRYLNVGTDLKFLLSERTAITNYRNESSLHFGVYHRFKDALYATFMINWVGFSLGASYDFNVSGLKAVTNSNGGMEIFLRYRSGFGGGKRPHKVRFI